MHIRTARPLLRSWRDNQRAFADLHRNVEVMRDLAGPISAINLRPARGPAARPGTHGTCGVDLCLRT